MHLTCFLSPQAALDAVTNGTLDSLELNIQSLPMLGKAPSSFTRPFMQSVGQIPLLEQVRFNFDLGSKIKSMAIFPTSLATVVLHDLCSMV